MRIVVYAEGAGESSSGIGLPPTPCEPMGADHLGAAHVLIARVIEAEFVRLQSTIQFVGPLCPGGRTARGSDLHNRKVVRQLFSWPDAHRRPDFGVLLVDDDGKGRLNELQDWVRDVSIDAVVGVAVQEFEAWLIADAAAVQGSALLPAQPETLRPGEAKKLLTDCLSAQVVGDNTSMLARRVAIARAVDLGKLERLDAFARFRAALRGAALRTGKPN